MPTWSKIGVPRGSFTSQAFLISNNLDRYLATIKETVVNPHNQVIEYYFSISHDLISWSEWKRLHLTSYDFLDEYKLSNLYVRFLVKMTSETEIQKPYLQSFELELKPFGYIENTGDLPVKPKLWIKKRNGSGSIQLINFTTGQVLELRDLNNNEEVYIDCENEEIVSSNQTYGVYRYDSHNDEYFELARGDNLITSYGDFDLDVRFKNILIQE